MAKKEACKFIRDQCAIKVEDLGKDAIINSAKTSMSSKIIGAESEFFANMAVEAVTRVKTTSVKGRTKYPIRAINILKAHGKSIKESELVDGFALNCVKAAQGMKCDRVHEKSTAHVCDMCVCVRACVCVCRCSGMPTVVKKAKIALLDIDLRKSKMAFGVQILVDDPSKLEDIRKKYSIADIAP